MEIYAGFLEQTDHEIGRVIDAIEELGFLDDTLIYYIIGDNGASAEGTINGCFNEMTTLNGMPGIETPEFLLSKIDDFGTPGGLQPLRGGLGARGCARRTSGPSRWPRTGAAPATAPSCTGPRRSAEARAKRPILFHHVIDVAPTILEAPDCRRPMLVNGIAQAPLEGVSMLATLQWRRCSPRRHEVQYFEMMGNRGIYFQGWTAVTKHRTPWKADTPPPFDDDVWELYGPTTGRQSHDLAAGATRRKLAELQRLWLIEAVKYNVVPLDDRGFERINPDIAGRPQLIRGTTQLLFSRHARSVSSACSSLEEPVVSR